MEEVAKHLADGEVAIFIEVGSKKMCYLVGVATAINNKGETRCVNLDSIYELAKELDAHKGITRAEF